MLRRYETIFIARSDLQSDEMSSLIDRYAGIVVSMDGKTVKVENWGKRRLAYPIEKMQDGVYVRIDYVATHKVVIEMERNFKIDDNVIRFQTVKLSDKVDLEEIEREIEDARKKEEDQRKEAQEREKRRKEEQEREEQKKEVQEKEEIISEPAVSETVAEKQEKEKVIPEPVVPEIVAEKQGKEEVIPEPVVSEVVAEEPDSKEVKTDDEEVVQETSSVETDEKKAEEE